MARFALRWYWTCLGLTEASLSHSSCLRPSPATSALTPMRRRPIRTVARGSPRRLRYQIEQGPRPVLARSPAGGRQEQDVHSLELLKSQPPDRR